MDSRLSCQNRPDNVFFGIQAFDDVGHPSSAVLSDTFAYIVPVDPRFVELDNGVPTVFAAPRTGRMQGIYTASGTVVYRRPTARGTHTLALPAGVYIVRCNDRVAKLSVR